MCNPFVLSCGRARSFKPHLLCMGAPEQKIKMNSPQSLSHKEVLLNWNSFYFTDVRMYWCPVSCPNNSLTQMLMSRCLGALKKSLRTDQCNFQFHSHDQNPEVTEVIWRQYIIVSLFSYSLSSLSLSYSSYFNFLWDFFLCPSLI